MSIVLPPDRLVPLQGLGETSHQEARHLSWLESSSIYIIREIVAQASNPALLFSGGKDSVVLLHLARKAFRVGNRPVRLPLPLLHIDTGHNFPEVMKFRDDIVRRLDLRLVEGKVEDSIARGTVVLPRPNAPRNSAQTVTLLEAIAENRFDALLGGARRDEEKSRAKERIFSFRDEFGQWDPKAQRPELWDLYNAKIADGEQIRVFPLSNWTELDIWQYIEREQLDLPSLYYAHDRPVIRRNGLLVPVTPLTPARQTDTVETVSVRFRTVGDITCTCPVESTAQTPAHIVAETRVADISERGATRMDDRTSEASMERRKKEGYF